MSRPAEQMAEELDNQPPLSQDEIDEQAFADEFDRRTGVEPEPEGDQGAQAAPEPEGAQGAQAAPEPEGAQGAPQPVDDQGAPQLVDDQGVQPPPVAAQPDPNDLLPDGSLIQRPDWYAELPEPAQQQFDANARQLNQLQWDYSNVHGRLAPVQRENERLQRRLAQDGQPNPAQASGQASQSQPTPATQEIHDLPEFKEYAEAFPEEAKAIEALFGAQTGQIAQLSERLTQISQGLEQVQSQSTVRNQQDELGQLTTAHPDWMQVRQTPDYQQWLAGQPVPIQQLDASPAAAECIYVLDAYKQAAYLSNLQQNPAPGPQADPRQAAAQQTQAHRQTLIQTPNPDPQGGGVGIPQGDPDANMSDEDMFAQEFERRVQAQRQHTR